MAQNDIIDTSNSEALKKVLEKEADFDEEEAYYELCEIIALAQKTGNYTKFQNDLNQWKKHYPIELFSDKYKSKIKYMLSEEFLDSILKNYLAFEKYSKLDPNKQLDKFRKIFAKAEHHKDEKRLDAELTAFYKDYPLEYLKEKFPHIIARLTSKSYIEKILQKFDSREAYEEFVAVIYTPKNYSSLSDFEAAIKPLQEKYPLNDFSKEYRSKLEPLLAESSLKQIFETANESTTLEFDDLDEGTIIDLEDSKALSSGVFNQKAAYFELLEIMKNPNDVNGVFDWTYKYMRFINGFDDYHKGVILSTLLPYYKIPKQHDYRIPIMDSKSHDYLSFKEYQSIDEIKMAAIIQYLAIISTTGNLTNDDIENLETIHSNSIKAQVVDSVVTSLESFEKESDNSSTLTLSDPDYFGYGENVLDAKVVDTTEVSDAIDKSKNSSNSSTVDYIVDDKGTVSSVSLDDNGSTITIDYGDNPDNDLLTDDDLEEEIIRVLRTACSNQKDKNREKGNYIKETKGNTGSNLDSNDAYKLVSFSDSENELESDQSSSGTYSNASDSSVYTYEDEDEKYDRLNDEFSSQDLDVRQEFQTFYKRKEFDLGERDL